MMIGLQTIRPRIGEHEHRTSIFDLDALQSSLLDDVVHNSNIAGRLCLTCNINPYVINSEENNVRCAAPSIARGSYVYGLD